ncbi:hypothetical protein C823_003347 [Eubacterium plexicaudatum ASF492]|nr:hypothetical protein C823_003347 [Eubacterium plexicaudatum ASF492]
MSRLKQIKSGIADIIKYITFRIWFRGIYCLYAKRPVRKDKVLFVEVRDSEVSDSFQLLYRKLKKEKSTVFTYIICAVVFAEGENM